MLPRRVMFGQQINYGLLVLDGWQGEGQYQYQGVLEVLP